MINKTTRSRHDTDDIPEFLVKTTMSCSVVVILILSPFAINNYINHLFFMGLAVSLAVIACIFNVWFGLRGSYSLMVNTYLASAAGVLSVNFTLIKLGSLGSYWPYLTLRP